MKVFKSFNPHGDPCPICGTKDDKPTVLIPIRIEEGSNITEAKQVHESCYLRELADAE